MWLLIDNYDSFSYMLWHYLKLINHQTVVIKNDEKSLQEIIKLNPERIILSPGPQRPENAGITLDVIGHFHNKIPILGICLGHQALGIFYGGQLTYGISPVHGKLSQLKHNATGIFTGIPENINVMRYHSLVVQDLDYENFNSLAFTNQDELMAFQHKTYPSIGLQFHPESILTEFGFDLLLNWSNLKF